MFNVWQASYLLTKDNDPLGVNHGLYVVLDFGFGRSFYRINLISDLNASDFEEYDTFMNSIFRGLPGENLSVDQELYCGGDTQENNLFLLHDYFAKSEKSIKITDGMLYLTSVDDIINSEEGTAFPNLWKIVVGVSSISDSDIVKNVADGNWIEFKAPAFLAYGRNPKTLADIAYRERRINENPFKKKGVFSKTLQIFKLIKSFKGISTETQLGLMRGALRGYFKSKKPDMSEELFEQVMEVHLSVKQHETMDITSAYSDIAIEDIAKRHANITKRALNVPIVIENRRLNTLFKELRIKRYLYDYIITSFFNTRPKNDNEVQDSPSAKNLEREFDIQTDIVKDK